MDLEKVKSILKLPNLRSTTKVRSFHGLVSFYKKFIKNFSGIYAPLNETIRGDTKEFKWTTTAARSFKLLKKKVIEQPMLALPNFSKVFYVDCDASGSTIGVVLS